MANNPDYTNVCSESADDLHYIRELCGDTSECPNISAEWEYNSSNNKTKRCPRDGNDVVCRRKSGTEAFQGDPAACCLQGYDLTEKHSDCFSDTNGQLTCAPKHRNPIGVECRAVFDTVCVNLPESLRTDTGFGSVWKARDKYCMRAIEANLKTPDGNVNLEGLAWAQGAMKRVFDSYYETGQIQGGGEFQSTLYSTCKKNPGICDLALSDYCSSYNRSDMANIAGLSDMCGCHLTLSNYDIYRNLYGVSKSCDPICSRPDNIPSALPNGLEDKCRANICIMDDITFDLGSSDVGNIDFSQVCGGCGGSSNCRCIIQDISITAVNATLGNINLKNTCRGSLDCYRTDPNDRSAPAVKVNCDNPDIPDPGAPNPEDPLNKFAILWWALAALGIVLLVGIIFIYFQSGSSKPTDLFITQNEVVLAPPVVTNNKRRFAPDTESISSKGRSTTTKKRFV